MFEASGCSGAFFVFGVRGAPWLEKPSWLKRGSAPFEPRKSDLPGSDLLGFWGELGLGLGFLKKKCQVRLVFGLVFFIVVC